MVHVVDFFVAARDPQHNGCARAGTYTRNLPPLTSSIETRRFSTIKKQKCWARRLLLGAVGHQEVDASLVRGLGWPTKDQVPRVLSLVNKYRLPIPWSLQLLKAYKTQGPPTQQRPSSMHTIHQ